MKLKLPVDEKWRVTQTWGENPLLPDGTRYYAQVNMLGHNGWDFGCPIGTPVYASHDGEVMFTGIQDGAIQVTIDTPDKLFRTFYGHLSSYSVKGGDIVKQGDQIGLSGNTGNHTLGAHLHFGIHHIRNYSDVDPNNGWNGACDPLPYFLGLTRNLYFGCSGEDVLVLQNFLKSNGYLWINNLTNFFGYATLKAVIAFQKANGLSPSVGFCGVLTRGIINKQLT